MFPLQKKKLSSVFVILVGYAGPRIMKSCLEAWQRQIFLFI